MRRRFGGPFRRETEIRLAIEFIRRELDAETVDHSIRVALSLSMTDIDVLLGALLHDVVEDGEVGLDMIEDRWGLTAEYLVNAMTRREEESYEDYIGRVKDAGRVAVLIKRADINDNLYGRTAPPSKTLQQRYERALDALSVGRLNK